MTLPRHKAIGHLDLDAFYAQVEIKFDKERLEGKPVAVVQYNPYGQLETLKPTEDRLMSGSEGSIIALNYAAKNQGVKRSMRGDEARTVVPDIQLVQVPTAHGKADLTRYREEGAKVLKIIGRKGTVERASVDEAYVDLAVEAQKMLEENKGIPSAPVDSASVHIMSSEGGIIPAGAWYTRPDEQWEPGEALLAAAASIMADLRASVNKELGYTLSGGLAHSKILAKLCSGLHKPAQQTVLPAAAISALLGPLPIPKLKALGGKFGELIIEKTGSQTVGELLKIPLPRLESFVGEKDANWLHNLCKGIDGEEVTERKAAKSIGCGKTFAGHFSLTTFESLHHWLLELGAELEDRLGTDREEHRRSPTLLTVNFSSELPWAVADHKVMPSGASSLSRSCAIKKVSAATFADDALGLVKRYVSEQEAISVGRWSISSLFLTASNFVPAQTTSITNFFKPFSASEIDKQAEGSRGGAAAPVAAQKDPVLPDKTSKSLISGIDPEVLAQLPDYIQREIKEQMAEEMMLDHARKSKRAPKASIKDFFDGGKRAKKEVHARKSGS